MKKLEALVADIPLRYLVLSVVSGLVVWLGLRATDWSPWHTYHNEPATAFTLGILGLLYVGVGIAPVVAIWRPLLATVLVLLPMPVSLVTEREWPFMLYVALMVVVVVGAWGSPRRAVAPAVVGILLIASLVAEKSVMLVPYGAKIATRHQSLTSNLALLAVYIVVTALVFGFALLLRANARTAMSAAEVERRGRAVDERGAVVEERARLARELHDVVAHHVSLIAVRAETAPYVDPDLDESARRALSEIGTEARLALDELRSVLGVLTRSTDEELAPQPTLADIDGLVARAREAGQDVELDGETGQEVGAVTGHTAYRLVQEALTNARKHAPGQTLRITLVGADPLVLTCTNELGETTAGPGSGFGLVAMRERVEAIGGRLDTRVEDGRHVLEATLPRGTR